MDFKMSCPLHDTNLHSRKGSRIGAISIALGIAISTTPLALANQVDHNLDSDPIYRTKKSIVINQSCSKVWPFIADFSGISSWYKGFRTSKRVAGKPGQVGEIRELIRASNGQVVQEKLIYMDQAQMELGYTHVKNGPVLNNIALVSLAPIEQQQCLATWSNTFRLKSDQDPKMMSTFFVGAYLNVLANLKSAAEQP